MSHYFPVYTALFPHLCDTVLPCNPSFTSLKHHLFTFYEAHQFSSVQHQLPCSRVCALIKSLAMRVMMLGRKNVFVLQSRMGPPARHQLSCSHKCRPTRRSSSGEKEKPRCLYLASSPCNCMPACHVLNSTVGHAFQACLHLSQAGVAIVCQPLI